MELQSSDGTLPVPDELVMGIPSDSYTGYTNYADTCFVFDSPTSVTSYDVEQGEYHFNLVGSAWVLQYYDSTVTAPPAIGTATQNCQAWGSYTIFAPADILMPFYLTLGIAVAIAIGYFAYRLLLYPFFRRISK